MLLYLYLGPQREGRNIAIRPQADSAPTCLHRVHAVCTRRGSCYGSKLCSASVVLRWCKVLEGQFIPGPKPFTPCSMPVAVRRRLGRGRLSTGAVVAGIITIPSRTLPFALRPARR